MIINILINQLLLKMDTIEHNDIEINISTKLNETNDILTNNILTNNVLTNDISTNDISTNDISTNDISTNDVLTNDVLTNDISTNNVSTNKLIYFLSLIIFICLEISFTICDLYYAYNDKTCVNYELGAINLKDYLLVEGWFNVIFFNCILLMCCYLCFNMKNINIKYVENNTDNNVSTTNIDTNINANNNIFCISITITAIAYVLLTFFAIIWDIIGAIIFWYLTNKSKCDDGIYYYMFISLIIKLTSHLTICLNLKCKMV